MKQNAHFGSPSRALAAEDVCVASWSCDDRGGWWLLVEKSAESAK